MASLLTQQALQTSGSYNLGDVLYRAVRGRADETILRCAKRACSGAELAEQICLVQQMLTQKGAQPGDRVLVMLRDTPAFYAAFIGAIRGGFIPVPISTLLPAVDVAFIADDADASLVLLDEALPDALRDPALYAEGTEVCLSRDWSFSDAPREARELEPWSSRRDDPCLWLYTSGSTGKPKGVIHRHGSAAEAAKLYGQGVLGIGRGDVILSAPKLYFGYGLGNSLFFPLLLGATVVLHPERPTPESIFELLQSERPTVFFGVPTLYARMLAAPYAPRALDSLRLCVSAGEGLAPSLYAQWRERYGVEILDGLGMTEAFHIFISNRPGEVRPGASGRVVSGYEVSLVDEEGKEILSDKPGTLVVGGPTMAMGYNRREEETKRVMFCPSWIRSSDVYRRDAQGYYYHLGRSDDLIKVSGQFVSPVEVEDCLTDHPDVLEAGVVAEQDANGLNQPMAFVVLRPEVQPSDSVGAELKRFVKARLTPHKYPRSIEFVDNLPRTGTGKIQRFVLRRRV